MKYVFPGPQQLRTLMLYSLIQHAKKCESRPPVIFQFASATWWLGGVVVKASDL